MTASQPGIDERTRAITLAIVTLAAFLNPFTGSSIDLALKTIATEFPVDAVTLSWVPSAYLLSVLIFLLPAGRLGDIRGRVSVFRTGVVIYTAATAAIVLIPSIHFLLALRFLQGIGSAMVFSTNVAIIADLYPAGGRGRALGINVTAVYAGLSLGPFLGGVLTEYFGWRSIFAVTLAMAGIVMALFNRIPESLDERHARPFDTPGAVLSGATLLSFFLGLSGITTTPGKGLLLAAPALFLVFWHVEGRRDSPLFPTAVFRANRMFTYSNLAALINYSATFAVALLVSLYLQYVRGLDPAAAGSVLFLMPLVQVVTSPVAGRLSDQVEPAILASAGLLVSGASLLGFSLLSAETPLWAVAALLMLLGLGLALFSSPNTNAIMGCVEKAHYGVASAMLGTMRTLGMMMSMGMVMVAFSVFIGEVPISPPVYPAFLASMKAVLLVFLVLSVTGAWFSWQRRACAIPERRAGGDSPGS